MINSLTSRKLVHQTAGEVNGKVAYVGIDPTGPNLHVGHLLPLLTIKRLSKLGIKPIVLIGGATAQIGDPSGKKTERELLSKEQVSDNTLKLKSQIQKIVPTALILNNLDWIGEITALELLRDIGKHFPVNVMLAKENVASRLEAGITFTEFTYQILQAFDFLHLAKEHNCFIQIGGSDQWGNITAGLELIRKKLGVSAGGITLPLLLNIDGTKIGKSEGEPIWLCPSKTSPFSFFQFWRNTPDNQVESRLLQLTNLEISEVQELINSTHGSAQEKLGLELVKELHGEEEVANVQTCINCLYKGSVPTSKTINELAKVLPNYTVGANVVEALVIAKLCDSKSQARRDLQANGVKINGRVVQEVTILTQGLNLLQKGKKNFAVLNVR